MHYSDGRTLQTGQDISHAGEALASEEFGDSEGITRELEGSEHGFLPSTFRHAY